MRVGVADPGGLEVPVSLLINQINISTKVEVKEELPRRDDCVETLARRDKEAHLASCVTRNIIHNGRKTHKERPYSA